MVYSATLWILINIPSWVILSTAQPNIVLMVFDDVSFGDVSYNGGPIPTPYIDMLANDNAIKLNYHYTETTCSPTRSALYTGRYAFKSGLNRNAQPLVANTLDRNLTLYPELLNDDGYRTFFAGKWHVGYLHNDTIPPTRGFDEGLYGLNRVVYKSRTSTSNWADYDADYPTTNAIKNARNMLFPSGPPPTHEMFKIVDGQNVPDGLGDNNDTYIETLYTNAILQFIDDHRGRRPFYIQYNFLTPHDPLTEPPALNTSWFYNYSICNISVLPDDQQLMCKMMLFAQERMDEIILKVEEKGFYDNTIFVVISDNAHNRGQSLPMRGTKGGYNEGGIRTPAFIFGGYIENLLNTTSSTKCEYDGLVHVSDWYNIFTDFAGITHSESDEDHELDILDDIRCSCGFRQNCRNGRFRKRTQIISMRLCGNENSLATDTHPAKRYHSAYIIDWPWKLIVNGSLDAECSPNTMTINSWHRTNSYSYFRDTRYNTPSQNFSDDYYAPKMPQYANLYKSECLEALDNTDDIDDPNYPPFVYDEYMLYNLETDKIEACNEAAANQQIVNDLFDKLEIASSGWNADAASDIASPGAMYAQILNYDCVYDVFYPIPWDQAGDDICGPIEDTEDDIDNRRCRMMWAELNDRKSMCNSITTPSPLSTAEILIDVDERSLEEFPWGLGLGIACILLIVANIILFWITYCGENKMGKHSLAKQMDDVVEKVNNENVIKLESDSDFPEDFALLNIRR